MPTKTPTIAALLSATLLTASTTAAQAVTTQDSTPQPTGVASEQASDSAPAIEPLAKDWTIRLEPYVGYIGPAGDLRLPSSTTRGGEVELQALNLDSPRLLPIGRIQAQRGKWRFSISGLGFDASDRGAVQAAAGQLGGIPFASGDRLVSDLSYQTFDLLASYRVWDHRSDTDANGRTRLGVGIDLIGGLRFHHADFEVRIQPVIAPGAGTPLLASADEFFLEPVIGARLELDILEQFGMEVESVAGGFGFDDRSSFSFSIDAGFVYRPAPPVGLKVGYRLMVFDLADGEGAQEFEWSGSMAGLYFGAQFSF